MRLLIIAILVVGGLVAFNSYDKNLDPMESVIDLKDQSLHKINEFTEEPDDPVDDNSNTNVSDDVTTVENSSDSDINDDPTVEYDKIIYGKVEKTIRLSCEYDSECRDAYPDAWNIECDKTTGLCIEYY